LRHHIPAWTATGRAAYMTGSEQSPGNGDDSKQGRRADLLLIFVAVVVIVIALLVVFWR
jgi:hypothetical protein